MATIARGAKTGGGTDFNTGQAMKSSEFNTDFNTIVTDYNGNITTANISASAAIPYSKLTLTGVVVDADMTTGTLLNRSVNASAAIALTKLDDISATDDAHDDTTTPGTSMTHVLPTTLSGELQQLRYAVERLGLGVAASRYDATGTREAPFWGDLPARGMQRIPGINGTVTSGLPVGWTNVATATLAQEAADAADGLAGKGRAIKITAAGSANEGMSYTLSGLKESTVYFVAALMKATSGDTARLDVTGGDATSSFRNFTADTTATTWTWVYGLVATDATPTSIVVRALAAADTDVVWVADVQYGECSEVPQSPRVAVIGSLQSDTVGTQAIDGGSDAGVTAGYRIVEAGTTDFDVTVYVPGDGYYIEVDSIATFGDTTTDTTAQDVIVKLYQSVSGGGLSAVCTVPASRETTGSGRVQYYTCHTSHFVASPTPGASYRYVIAATRDDHNVTAQKGSATTTYLRVKVVPY